jgi:hypothetical protein
MFSCQESALGTPRKNLKANKYFTNDFSYTDRISPVGNAPACNPNVAGSRLVEGVVVRNTLADRPLEYLMKRQICLSGSQGCRGHHKHPIGIKIINALK